MGDKLYDFFFGTSPKRSDYMYDTPHVVTLIVTFVVAIFFAVIARKLTKKQKHIVLWCIFGALLAFEIMHRIYRLEHQHEWYKFIPIHFSSISVWVTIIAIGSRSKKLLSLATLSYMLASLAFLFHPAVGFDVTIFKFNNYYSIITHSIGFVFSVFTISAGLVSYKIKDLWLTILYICLVLIYSAVLNFALFPGKNYLYYVDNVTSLPYWVFLIGYFGIIIVYVTAYYLVDYHHSKRISNRKNKIN